jgi:methyl-accepting chemotaxis protein
MSEIKDSLNEIVNGTARRVGNARELKGLYLFQVIDEKNLIIETDYMKIESWGDVLNKRHQEIFQVIENAKKIANEEGSKDLEKFSELYSGWWKHSGEVIALAKARKSQEAFTKSSLARNLRLDVAASLDGIVDRNTNRMQAEIKKADDDYNAAKSLVILVSVCSIIGCSVVSFLVLRNLNKSIEKVISILSEGSSQVTSASQQIASSSEELSQSTTEQASSLEETASSIEEMNSMVQRNAENAARTSKLANESRGSAEKGKKVVTDMISSISEINESNDLIKAQIEKNNQQISDIVTVIAEIESKTQVINDIVFQTKLLSFNASVEAARAAEHGKGFAVVAEEVGSLAQMSGNAAKEISSLLEQSMAKVELIVAESREKIASLITHSQSKISSGTRIANECGKVLDEIVLNVSNVTQMANEISIACSEQAQGVQEITKAMNQLDQVTQMNASTSEEVASSAEDLSTQADSLKTGVQVLVQTVQGSDSVEAVKENNVIPFPEKKLMTKKSSKTWISKKRPEGNTPHEDDIRFEEA